MQFRKLITTTSLAISLLFGLSAFADNSAILGKWAMVIDVQGQVFELDLNLTEKEGILAGDIMSAQGGGAISDVKFENDQLSYTSDDGQGGSVKTTLKLTDGKLEGSLATQMGDIPISGTRSS